MSQSEADDRAMEAREAIIQILRAECEQAMQADRLADCHLAAVRASRDVWEQHSQHDGIGFRSQNPYNPEPAVLAAERTRKRLVRAQLAYEFAVDRFVAGDEPCQSCERLKDQLNEFLERR